MSHDDIVFRRTALKKRGGVGKRSSREAEVVHAPTPLALNEIFELRDAAVWRQREACRPFSESVADQDFPTGAHFKLLSWLKFLIRTNF